MMIRIREAFGGDGRVLTPLPLPRAWRRQVIETTPCGNVSNRRLVRKVSRRDLVRRRLKQVSSAYICARCEGAVLFDLIYSAALVVAGAPRLSTILRLYRTDDKGGRIESMCCTGGFMLGRLTVGI
jgi:hypothetical protein